MPDATISVEELADLLMETGHHHHQAYISADGTDPEWALWYSGYLQSRLWERASGLPTRSLLVHLLLSAEAAYGEAETEEPWPRFYAEYFLERLGD